MFRCCVHLCAPADWRKDRAVAFWGRTAPTIRVPRNAASIKEEIAMNPFKTNTKEERQLSREEESSSSSPTRKCRFIDTTAQGKRHLMFILRELEIEGRPELSKFPLNVLFADYTIRDGVRTMGSALYEPDLSSLGRSGSKYFLLYNNKYGGDCHLRITYDTEKEAWEGEKIIDRELAWTSHGRDWQLFFEHF